MVVHVTWQTDGTPRKPLPYMANLPAFTVANGLVTRESLKAASMMERAMLINRILALAADRLFGGFVVIKSARCPVIRMLHLATEIRIDLSINNRCVFACV